jgi:iron complex transport system substrate-binding protein
MVLTGEWTTDVANVAAAANRAEAGQALLDEYEDRAESIGQQLAEQGDTGTVAFVRVRDDGVRVHTNLHFAGNILDDVGLAVPEAFIREPTGDLVEDGRNRIVELSPEQIGELAAADVILVAARGRADREQDAADALAELQSSSLWQSLPAVQAGDVHEVGAHWVFGGQREAMLVLDDVERTLLGSSAAPGS